MRPPRLTNQEARLLQPPAPARFGAAELDGLPESVRRHLSQAIAPGTPLATAARLRMRGRIKVGRWLPFRAHQVLNPHHGFVWTARAAGIIAGCDRYLDGNGRPGLEAPGPAHRGPRPGPRRRPERRRLGRRRGHLAAHRPAAPLRGALVGRVRRPGDGRLQGRGHPGGAPAAAGCGRPDRVAGLRRWGDPDNRGSFGWHRFGGEFTGYGSFQGLTIPCSGRLGWFYGQDRWPAGEFFRYQLTDLEPVAEPAGQPGR